MGSVGTLVALVVAGGSVVLARRAGLTAVELGLVPTEVETGVRWGLGVTAVAVPTVLATAALPATEALFTDERYRRLSGGGVVRHAVVRIPFGMALAEELVFRGVLLAALRRRLAPGPAIAISSGAFGLWHVVPAMVFAGSNAAVPRSGARAVLATVAATVGTTAVAGGGLAWLRLRSDSLAAPLLVHAAVNASALAVTWARGRRTAGKRRES